MDEFCAVTPQHPRCGESTGLSAEKPKKNRDGLLDYELGNYTNTKEGPFMLRPVDSWFD